MACSKLAVDGAEIVRDDPGLAEGGRERMEGTLVGRERKGKSEKIRG